MINWKDFLTTYRGWRRRWFYPLISVAVALSLCLSAPLPGRAIELLPLLFQGAQILKISNISDRDEVRLGKQMNQQLQRQEVRIYRNSSINSYVEQIGRRLAANSDRRNIPYTFQVVEDDAVNAFATMGGYVYINTGLLKIADNEAEVASVIAHEMGHIEGKHALNQLRQSAIASGVATLTGVDQNKLVGLGVELVLKRPRSRKDEYDADTRGLRTLTKTGYAPSAMVSFMKKLLNNSSVPTVLSTHPGTSDRILSLQRQIQASPNYGNYGLDSSAYQANIRVLKR
ncbi:M48 family metallopeptidase [Cronbergia sp. UHCC 0137]|uniref:M48 family metallopeptidase n=1 Tax=Cronbergia sp. UHCC 0137 TaxID=3110239 RepID=UPI002B1EE88F|nr:M48 family metallopeptidase [Cronbergia sp. UHCC 0137]MEA5616301.1 M48 family metallopeptidase [Cronbergia sp. UHCC 0137]